MSLPQLGKLSAVSVADIWKHEALEFTPWLARPENLATLARDLHLGELTLKAVERGVGDFSADIVAEDEGGGQVLIENQLAQTDHRHLGQVLTYLAGISGLEGDATIIWIATRIRDEHRAAIDWLNTNTNERFDFFGVEIEVLKIGDSAPAPRFNVIAKPNHWSRALGQNARRISSGTGSETQTFYTEYWLALKEVFDASGATGNFPKAWPRHYLPFLIGRSGFQLDPVLIRSEKRIRFELYMHQKDMPPKAAFLKLLDQKADIEREIGYALEWQELPNNVASRISIYLPADPSKREDWPRQHTWIVEQLRNFRRVFQGRVRALDFDSGDDTASGLEAVR